MGLGFLEICLIFLVALVVLKPEDWPRLAYGVGRVFKNLNVLRHELKKSYRPLIDAIELEDIVQTAQKKAHQKEPLRPPSHAKEKS
jgi:Sec-independent protein translocase protein TatA